MIYEIRLSDQVKLDLVRLAKSEPKGRWSREITKKHRLIYRIFETEVYVDVLSAYGHYDDK